MKLLNYSGKLRTKILMIVGLSCLICLTIAVAVARYFNEKSLHNGIIDKSLAIHTRLEASTKFVAKQGGLRTTIERFTSRYHDPREMTEDDKLDVLKQVPIFAAMQIGKEGAEKEHYAFRVFSDQPRRKENQATAEEMEIFNKFLKDPALEEWVIDDPEFISVFKPVRLSKDQGCLNCHGDPATSPWKNGKDILGIPMENWEDGKLHGVFVLSTRVKDVKVAQAQHEFMSTDQQIGLFIGFGALIALALSGAMIRGPLNRVKAVSERLVIDSAEVGSAVSQIFAISQELSTASTQQAESVQETAAAIEEISNMVKRSADNAGDSEKASSQSKASAEKGREIVTHMVSSMKEINRSNEQVAAAVTNSNQKISEIVAVIQEIGSKTKIINDIVFQTKLLSFNASVEAARAGEHGKGFAVVAEEVGNLAAMSGNAARDITNLLDESVENVKAIVEDTKTTIEGLMINAKAAVDQGSAIATDCEGVLAEIVASSADVSGMVSSIATASHEQANGVNEISKAIQQIDKTTQVAASSADSCSEAAEQLSEKVKGLRLASAELRLVIDGKVTVNKFKWNDAYSLGIDNMDGEHKILIEKMNQFAEMLESRDGLQSGAVKQAFSELASYTKKHFSHEEAYMESIGYPDILAHKSIHTALLSQVTTFKQQVDSGQVDGAELMDFLNDWLMRHILGVDMKYSRFAIANDRAA